MPDRFAHGYALLIGVGRCAYAPWSLPVTVRDMQALRAVLTDPGLCGYPADQVRLLHDEGATRQAILDGLAWLAARAAADPDATTVVFYSGHGWQEERMGRYFLIPHDVAPFDLAGSALTAEAFIAALQMGVSQNGGVVMVKPFFAPLPVPVPLSSCTLRRCLHPPRPHLVVSPLLNGLTGVRDPRPQHHRPAHIGQ